MDVEKANKDLDNFEAKREDENEKLKQLIASTSHAYSTIYLESTPIRIKKYMPKKIRHKMLRVAKQYEELKDVEVAESELYEMLAAMCLDEPFNLKRTWEFLDEETGCAQDAVIRIAEEVARTDKNIKSFR